MDFDFVKECDNARCLRKADELLLVGFDICWETDEALGIS